MGQIPRPVLWIVSGVLGALALVGLVSGLTKLGDTATAPVSAGGVVQLPPRDQIPEAHAVAPVVPPPPPAPAKAKPKKNDDEAAASDAADSPAAVDTASPAEQPPTAPAPPSTPPPPPPNF